MIRAFAASKKADEPVVQLATRVPVSLLQRVKIHCVTREQTMQDFVREAIEEKLKTPRGK